MKVPRVLNVIKLCQSCDMRLGRGEGCLAYLIGAIAA